MAFEGFDHLDLRVPSLAAVEAFYDRLLPALGLTEKRYSYVTRDSDWSEPDARHPANAAEWYEEGVTGRPAFFMGVIEDGEDPSRTRIAFRVAQEELDAWEARLREFGARNVERSDDMQTYPSLFFQDPVGTRLEICARRPR